MSDSIPYLGSKISLISKSEIRYEGILYTIDAQDSIIALAKVQSFGTEDRPVEIPVPAKNEVYEYIIFRGTDIKKIEVCESPKQPLSGGLHNDPAIVGLQQHAAPAMQSSYQATSFNRHQSLGPIGSVSGPYYGAGYSQQMGQQNLSSTGGFSIGSSQPSELSGGLANSVAGGVSIDTVSSGSNQHIPAPIGAPIGAPSSQAHQPQDVLSGSRSSTPSVSRKSPVSDAGVQVSPPPQDKRRNQSNQRSPQENFSYARNNSREGNQVQNRRGGQNYYQGGPRQGYQGGYNNQYNQGFQGGRGGMRGRAPRRPTQARGGRGGFNQGNRQRHDQQIFTKEFDFEQANEEFEELRTQLAKTQISENGEVKEEKKEDSGHETATTGDESEDSGSSTFYNKAKSFFDSISCEALERSKGRSQRPDWRQERKINVQTFGVATARRGYYPRGRGGYYNNRGGYYRNYNQGGYYRGGNNGGGGYRGRGGNYTNYTRGQSNDNNQSASVPTINSNTVNGAASGSINSTSSYASAAKSATVAK